MQVNLWVLKWQGAALEHSRSTRKLWLAQHLQEQAQVLVLVLVLGYYLGPVSLRFLPYSEYQALTLEQHCCQQGGRGPQ